MIFALLGLSDLTATALPDEIGNSYWGTQAPVRLSFFFLVTGYSWVTKPGGLFSRVTLAERYAQVGLLNNSVIFTWAFLETMVWFWFYVTLRDERREMLASRAEKNRAEQDRF